MKKLILLSVLIITCATFSKPTLNSCPEIGGGNGTTPKPGGGTGGGIIIISDF